MQIIKDLTIKTKNCTLTITLLPEIAFSRGIIDQPQSRISALLPREQPPIRGRLNNFPEKGRWDWTYLANPSPALKCSHKRGVGIHDLAVRFADITGNGRADYLCLSPTGVINGFLHQNDGSFKDVGQVKFSEGKDRANLRFGDVNGDGKDDLIFINKFNGNTYVWYSEEAGKPADLDGSSWRWREQSSIAFNGLRAGTCIFYTDLDGNGRVDEHYVLGVFVNDAETSYAPSCGLTNKQGDDSWQSPELPSIPVGPDVENPCADECGWKDNFCDNNKTYTDLDALDKEAAGMDSFCVAWHMVNVLLKYAFQAYDDFSNTLSGYDSAFDTYKEYIHDTTNATIANFLNPDRNDKNAFQYFKCYYKQGWTSDRNGAQERSCKESADPAKEMGSWWLELTDKDSFEDALGEAGLSSEWVSYGDREEWPECYDPEGICPFNYGKWFHDYPVMADDYEIENPKVILEKAFNDGGPLISSLLAAKADLYTFLYDGNDADLVEVLSVGVWMAMDSVSTMKEVKEVAEKIDAENKKKLILLILESVLFAIPFLGAAAGSLGRTGTLIARMVYLLDTAGNGALSVYSIIEEPTQAPLAIMAMVLDLGAAGRSNSKISELAGAKRKFAGESNGKMGSNYRNLDGKVGSIMTKTCKKSTW